MHNRPAAIFHALHTTDDFASGRKERPAGTGLPHGRTGPRHPKAALNRRVARAWPSARLPPPFEDEADHDAGDSAGNRAFDDIEQVLSERLLIMLRMMAIRGDIERFPVAHPCLVEICHWTLP